MAASDAELQVMLDDCHAAFGEACGIVLVTEGAFNTATQLRAKSQSANTVTAIRSERRVDSLVGGQAQVEETVYHIRVNDGVSSGVIVEPGWWVVDGDNLYKVHRVERGVNDLALAIYCRGKAKMPAS